MRPEAEVDEFSGRVERHHRLLRLFFHELAFENLARLFVKLERLAFRYQLAFIGQIARRQLAHLRFDLAKIFQSERLVAEKFVEEARLNRRADAELDVWIKFQDGRGEQVRRRVAKNEECVGIFFRQDLQPDVAVERPPQIDQFTRSVAWRARRGRTRRRHARHQRRVRQPRRNVLGNLRRRRAFRHVLDASIRQCDVDLLHRAFTRKEKHLAYRRHHTGSRRCRKTRIAPLRFPLFSAAVHR